AVRGPHVAPPLRRAGVFGGRGLRFAQAGPCASRFAPPRSIDVFLGDDQEAVSLLDDAFSIEAWMPGGDHEVLVIGASLLVLLGRELDPRHARVVDALAQERNELARCDEVIDSFVQTLVGGAENLLVLDIPVLSRRHGSLIPGAPKPKTGSAGILPVFDDRIPTPGHEHADARLVAVIRVDQVTARLFERDFVVPSGDVNRLD